MMASNSRPRSPETHRVLFGGRELKLTYQQLFAAGHRLWKRGDYKAAAKIFKYLSSSAGRGPRARIMLAHCCAMLGDYSACCAALHAGLDEPEHEALAGELHEIFVYWKAGLLVDAKQRLQKVAAEQAQLPTLCLLLAELMSDAGNQRLSDTLFLQCIERDRPDGAIGLIAKSRLSRRTEEERMADERPDPQERR